MQHNRFGRKLRRTTSHRIALFRNQLMSMVEHERIATTLEKAKELRPLVERVVTMGKNDSVPARRRVFRWVPDRTLVKKVFDKLGPRFTDRPGGYTRILRLGRRRGDNAETAILEFVDFQFKAKEKGPKRESTMERARRAVSSKVETIRKEKPEAEEAAEDTAPAAETAPKSGRGKVKPARTAGGKSGPKVKAKTKKPDTGRSTKGKAGGKGAKKGSGRGQ
jgi:large subunit ribosomal protein L17